LYEQISSRTSNARVIVGWARSKKLRNSKRLYSECLLLPHQMCMQNKLLSTTKMSIYEARYG